jgi:lipoprotein-releasing system permease protein
VYKLLLCWQYLRTRYLAFICIVSVMLGVATLIVVNSVMSGFSNKLKVHMHGVLADVTVLSDRSDGLDESSQKLIDELSKSPVGKHVEAYSPTVEVFALLQFDVFDKYGRTFPITKHVRLIGVDPAKHASVGRFADYLVRQKGVQQPSFDLPAEALLRLEESHRRHQFQGLTQPFQVGDAPRAKGGDFLKEPELTQVGAPMLMVPPPDLPAAPMPKFPGMIIGYSLAHHRYKDPDTGVMKEVQLLRQGDDVTLTTVAAGVMKPATGTFYVADYFRSEMSEYDSSFVYVPLDELQRIRGMDPGRVNSIQMKLKGQLSDDSRLVHDSIVPEMQRLFPPAEAKVLSWQQQQGPLLAAIDIERGILNILLFMIVGVAGFSVLAIFTMIVTEKHRDIGIMKSLGASNQGVMSIFLSYGLMLAIIGSILGTIAGVAITVYINEIEIGLAKLTGQQIFDRSIYYFDKIPTNIEPMNVVFINIGAIAISAIFSVLPAWRASRLHPVQALRFE